MLVSFPTFFGIDLLINFVGIFFYFYKSYNGAYSNQEWYWAESQA